MRRRMKQSLAFLLVAALLLSACGKGSNEPSSEPAAPIIKNESKVSGTYDLIVVGGEPEGIAAAVSGARNGLKTLLICESGDLGGLYTEGQLNFIDVPETRSGKVLVEGIYKEFFDAVGGSGFDIDVAKKTFYNIVKNEENITLRVNSKFKAPVKEGDVLKGITVAEDNGEATYYGGTIIDATADANVAAAAGAPYTFAGEDIGEKDRHMGVTLVFGLKGLDWDKIVQHLTLQRAKAEVAGETTDMGARGDIAWGYTREGFDYEPKDPAIRLRGFNMSRQIDGTVLFNALIIFDVDSLDEKSRQEGIARGQNELEHIVPYLREKCVGFSNAELAGTADALYVRESRHIDCEYMLTIDDVLENRKQPDMICVTNYPVDVQPTKTQRFGTVVGFPDQYTIGFRSLVPLEVDNLMVVGRSAGYRSMAAGSARIVPTGMACAQAAGVAAALQKEHNVTPREMCKDESLIQTLQNKLTEQGASLEHEEVKEPVMDHWAYSGLKILRAMGFMDGGYDNNYRLDETVTKNGYQNMVNNVLRKSGFPPEPAIIVNDDPPVRQIIGTMARAVGERKGTTYENDNAVYLAVLQQEGIMADDLLPYFSDMEKQPQNAEVVMLVANFYKWLIEQPGAQKLIALEDELL